MEKISDVKRDKEYTAVWLENEYLRVMVLPELGGRIQRAYDKTNDYDFVYYNHVIKPALVGLTGPWISGGIEFNWPQHHRPTTFRPVDYVIQTEEDGSASVLLHDVDQMYGTKGIAKITLHPGKACLLYTSSCTKCHVAGRPVSAAASERNAGCYREKTSAEWRECCGNGMKKQLSDNSNNIR